MLLSVEEYEPLLNPFAAPLLVDDVLESDLLEVLSLLLEKFPDLKPSPLFELVESLVVLVEDLPDELEPLKDPELNPLLDFELLELDLLLLELDLLLDLAKAIVLLVGIFMPINDKASNGKLENVNINVRKIVKTYFLVIL
ncbi:hypothetical protein CLCHR_21860 [Clostridium chromiireducens]|uniref:Uncharacterized protein n=1 Tax=Clostridium chromiireducens TaxID=225345 RepID=A0A1V4IQG2_9CLOT|nr:hypothetical protein CLCHR_21860 [Clostridium chromiireducens]